MGSVYSFDPNAPEEAPLYPQAAPQAAPEAAQEAAAQPQKEEEEETPSPGGLGGLWRLPGRLSSGRKGLLAAGLILFCLGVGTAALLLPRPGQEAQEAAAPRPAPVRDASTRSLDPFIFAAGGGAGEETFYKVGLAVQFADPAAARLYDDSVNAVRRDIYDFLSHAAEQEGLPQRKAQVQEAVRDLINARLGAHQAVKVYFRELLVV